MFATTITGRPRGALAAARACRHARRVWRADGIDRRHERTGQRAPAPAVSGEPAGERPGYSGPPTTIEYAIWGDMTSRVADATVAALLIAKASLATERGVDLRLHPASHVGKVYGELSRDLTTVVGNLVDNALDATAALRPSRGSTYAWSLRRDAITVTRRGQRARGAERRRGVPPGLHDQGDGRRRGRGPRLRAGPDPAGVPSPGRGRHRPQRRHGAALPLTATLPPTRRRWRQMIEVLVVDDDFMVARIHTGFVERTPGFSVTGIAHTGAQALGRRLRLQPDLVLLDVYLPDVSGLDLLAGLREAAPEVDVLVISAAREADTVRRALRGGIVHYLIKPFSYDDLRLRLEHYQQAYAGMSSDTRDQADVDRLFGVAGADKRLPKGFSPETLRLVEDSLRSDPPRRPLRRGGGRPARHLPGQRASLPRAPERDREGRGQPALRRGGPPRAALRLAVTWPRHRGPDRLKRSPRLRRVGANAAQDPAESARTQISTLRSRRLDGVQTCVRADSAGWGGDRGSQARRGGRVRRPDGATVILGHGYDCYP